jgi:hypothetical protein
LHRWRFHPAIAHEAVRWAIDAHSRIDPATVTVAAGPRRSMAVAPPAPPSAPPPSQPTLPDPTLGEAG